MSSRKPLADPRKSSTSPSLQEIVSFALAEDVGEGDVSAAIFGEPSVRATARFIAKQPGILSGAEVVREVFRQLDARSRMVRNCRDGSRFSAGQTLLTVTASLSALLTGERTALNFVQRLSGVATLTRQYVDTVGKSGRCGIFDTRKTTPLLRAMEKHAVLHGGGNNHRFGLFDMAMLKNNHIDAAGGIAAAVALLIRTGFLRRKPRLRLCVEARTAAEAVEATVTGADIVMLDNMSPVEIRATVRQMRAQARRLASPMPEVEISGGIRPEDLKALGRLPVQRISVGRLTHSAPAIDISMRIS